MRIRLIVAIVLLTDCSQASAGSVYTWQANGVGSYTEIYGVSPAGEILQRDVPTKSGTFTLYRDFQGPGTYNFGITAGPGYYAGLDYSGQLFTNSIEILPGSDLDRLVFHTSPDIFFGTSAGTFEIFAPSGTLAKFSDFADSLGAFEEYSKHNHGGSWSYFVNYRWSFPFAPYGVYGTLGTVPEPASLVLMSIGVITLLVVNKWRTK